MKTTPLCNTIITMLQSMFVFHAGIVFLCIVTHTRGEQSSVFVTNEQYEWFEAKRKCTLLTNERKFSVTTRLGWTNFSAKYLPWVEYLGCFKFGDLARFTDQKKQVTGGEQLQECIMHCNRFELFGLQESTCICLPNSYLANESVEKPCDTNMATCSGDPFSFCGRVGNGGFVSVYRNDASVNNDNHKYKQGYIGNCLVLDKNGHFKAYSCSKTFQPLCFDDVQESFNTGNKTRSNWRYAFGNCHPHNLANFNTAKDNSISISNKVWLSNIRRWIRIIDVAEHPEFCVAAKIKKNGDVERFIHSCRDQLPGICIDVRNTSTDALSKTSSTLSTVTVFSSRLEKTSPSVRSNTFQNLTMSTYSTAQRSSFLSRLKSTSPALKETTGISEVVQKTTFYTPEFQETPYQVFVESTSSDLPDKGGVLAKVIIAIVAATILIVIVILVTVVICRRKRSTQVQTSHESVAMVGKEVVYAHVNKPTVKREKSTSSQKSQPAASDDTYDHMEHCRLSQTHNPTESDYDTMRSIANAGEEENNYDHVTGTKMEPKRFVVDSNTDYSHVEVEFHEDKDM